MYPVLRLGHVASTKTSNVDKKSYDGGVTVRLCNYTDVYKNDTITSDMNFMVATATQDQVGKFGLKVGDTVFTKDSETADDIGIPAYIGESAHDLVCGYHLAIARPFMGAADPRFLYWCLASPDAAQQWSVLASGVTRVGLRQADIGKLEIPVPPLQIQRNVAAFLDRETAQSNELIGKQERLIELLAEKRQAIITHAVTKGLDPTAPTKPSGIPWLGEVPQTWRTAELKRALTFVTSGSRGWAEYYADQGKPFVRIGNLTRGHLHLDMAETQHVEVPPDAEGTRAVVEAGDVLFSITAYLGSVAVATEKESGSYVSQHVAITRLDQNRLHPRFLAYFVLSEFGQRQLNEGAYGGAKLQLSLEDIKKLMMPIPGMTEQIEIVRHLDTSTARIDTLVELSRKSVSLLRERHSALISAAVTGRIDVTNEGVVT